MNESWTVDSNPQGAAVTTTSGLSCGGTPCTFKIRRKSAFWVTLSKPGYVTYQTYVSHRVADAGVAGVAANVLVGGVVGAGLDVADGSSFELHPNPLFVDLRKVGEAPPGPEPVAPAR